MSVVHMQRLELLNYIGVKSWYMPCQRARCDVDVGPQHRVQRPKFDENVAAISVSSLKPFMEERVQNSKGA